MKNELTGKLKKESAELTRILNNTVRDFHTNTGLIVDRIDVENKHNSTKDYSDLTINVIPHITL